MALFALLFLLLVAVFLALCRRRMRAAEAALTEEEKYARLVQRGERRLLGRGISLETLSPPPSQRKQLILQEWMRAEETPIAPPPARLVAVRTCELTGRWSEYAADSLFLYDAAY